MSANPLSNLSIDFWYKATLAMSAVLLILSLTIDIKVIGNLALVELATGGILISLGEWINHPLQTTILPHGKLTSYNRLPNRLGTLFGILGSIIIVIGAFEVYRQISLPIL